MLYLRQTCHGLALKLFRGEPAISGFDWNFSPIHTSSPPFSTDVCSRYSLPLRQLHPWTWIDHPVSVYDRRLERTFFHSRFRFGSVPEVLNLTTCHNSPDRSTKSTPSHIYSAPTACKHRVSGSLSLPLPGVICHLSFTVLCATRSLGSI